MPHNAVLVLTVSPKAVLYSRKFRDDEKFYAILLVDIKNVTSCVTNETALSIHSARFDFTLIEKKLFDNNFAFLFHCHLPTTDASATSLSG